MGTIQTTQNLQEFFYHLVRSAIEKQRLTVSAEAEYYLVQLLYRFAKLERGERIEDQTLVSLLHQALEASETARVQLLKQVGDLALYVAGYFPESLSRKLVNVDYYMRMGGHAYGSVAEIIVQPHVQSLFGELSAKFPYWVDILGEVSAQTQSRHSGQDLLRLYELWQRTGSLKALNLLQQEGILPGPGTEQIQ